MDKPFINHNDFSSTINSLMEKIQLLDSETTPRHQKLLCTKEMLEEVDSLRENFAKAADFRINEHKLIFTEKIERALSQFEWNTKMIASPLDFKMYSDSGKSLISALLKLLGSRGCGLLIIETYMKLCMKTVLEMKENIDKQNSTIDKSNFKLLLDGFSSTANILKKYWHIAFVIDQKRKIMLCLHQICNILPHLLKMITLKNIDLKKFLLNLLIKCLNKITSEIHNEDLKSKSPGSDFITMMDFCLYKLNELSNSRNDFSSFIKVANTDITVLKPVIDELLCSVMSIAQVTVFEEDYSAILSSSQKVLREFSDLKKEIEEENRSSIRLYASSLGESLCSLEQKVNNAVLKLVLEVFSNVGSSLKNILNKCKMNITKDNKATEDLNVLITDFDSEMDRIMQIGLFAISCTTSVNRILGIQSCLASLESLETELILSLTALYVNCSSKNKANFLCLFDFWLDEITKLKVLIDSVLDAAGFCGVVLNQIKSLRLTFKDDTSFNLCFDTLSCNLKKTIKYSKKLIKTLRTNMEDEKDNFKTTDEYLVKFQLAVQECEAVLDLMKEGQDTKKIFNQAVKRYDFLIQNLEKLSSHLFLLASDEEYKYNEKESFSNEINISNIQIPQKNYYKLYEPSDITLTPNKTVPEILTPYVNKGILRSKKRNMLYITPEEADKEKNDLDKTMPQNRYWDKTPASSKRSRCCKPLTLNLELENTIDLEITTVLENISKLSNTFSKASQESGENSVIGNLENNDQDSGNDMACGTDNNKPTYTSSGCCTDFDLEENEPNEKEENFEVEKGLLGFQLRNRFLQTLEDLSHKDSLLVASNGETPTTSVDSFEIKNDLKLVEEKINFLKT